MKITIIFVCTANRCRSLIAEALFKLQISQNPEIAGGLEVNVCSAGILTEDYWEFIEELAGPHGCKVERSKFYGVPPYPETIRCLAGSGFDVSSYRSQPLDDRLAREASLVVTMESNQRAAVLDAYPWLKGRACTFREFVGETGTVIYEDTLFRPVFDAADPHCVYYTRAYVEANFREIDAGFRTGREQMGKVIRMIMEQEKH